MVKIVLDGVGNVVGKGENAGFRRISPFPTMFSKSFFPRFVKSRDCLVKVMLL